MFRKEIYKFPSLLTRDPIHNIFIRSMEVLLEFFKKKYAKY